MRATNNESLEGDPPPAVTRKEGASLLATPKQVADLLQVSTRTLWRMRSAGSLPTPVRLGAAVRWRRAEIEAWIREGCPSAGNRDNDRRRN
ncbi:helix-turn-helix transcriptional regulator [Adhaeretor mobilis]|uniref:Helix-turn-helix domain protein n=1 Tax=Adhaeretor mobilis TaxID=1930276 RepID=A0A517MQB8_9BACT|nr:helix-turn-helix domain-containing protein [Adhaeretor mobilis]QDS97083.1 Helix-turn-helix domain protein [Adhaeretor mobilis]